MRPTSVPSLVMIGTLVALAACSGGGGPHAGAIPFVPSGTARGLRVDACAAAGPCTAHGNLYVADEREIREYRANDPTPVRTIDNTGVKTGLAVDSAGDLYVANKTTHTVQVYAPGSRVANRTVNTGRDGPTCFALVAGDGSASSGDWWAGNGGHGGFDSTGSVAEYGPTSDTPIHVINEGDHDPQALATDAAGNLYVLNGTHRGDGGGASVDVYPPNSSRPFERITQGIVAPSSMLLATSGELYVGDNGPTPDEQKVVEFAPGDHAPTHTYREPLHAAGVEVVVALSPAGGLAVGAGDEVLVYRPGSTELQRTIKDEIDGPTAMLFNHAGDLFVANPTENAVTEYDPGKVSVASTVISPYPDEMTFGP